MAFEFDKKGTAGDPVLREHFQSRKVGSLIIGG